MIAIYLIVANRTCQCVILSRASDDDRIEAKIVGRQGCLTHVAQYCERLKSSRACGSVSIKLKNRVWAHLGQPQVAIAKCVGATDVIDEASGIDADTVATAASRKVGDGID